MSYGTQYNPLGSSVPQVPFEQPQSLFRFGEQTLWSTQFIPNGTALANQRYRLFATPLGQVGQGSVLGLSISETNLKVGGQVPSGVAYDVFGVSSQVMAQVGAAAGTTFANSIDTQAEINELQGIVSAGVLQWDFTQTLIDIAPMMLCGAGGGLFGAVAQNAAGANSGAMNNGNGSIFMYRKHPVALPGGNVFAIQLSFGSLAQTTAAGISFAVRVVLLGYYKNVIEIG